MFCKCCFRMFYFVVARGIVGVRRNILLDDSINPIIGTSRIIPQHKQQKTIKTRTTKNVFVVISVYLFLFLLHRSARRKMRFGDAASGATCARAGCGRHTYDHFLFYFSYCVIINYLFKNVWLLFNYMWTICTKWIWK